MRRQFCDACGYLYADLYPVAMTRAWWSPARWLYGRVRVINCCRECAWELENDHDR